MKFALAILISLYFFGCGGSSHSDKPDRNLSRYSPLSLEESKRLITPTIYYIPIYNLDKMKCDGKKIKDNAGAVLFNACKEVYDGCQMQGTCQIQKNSKKVLVHVDDVIAGERRFAILKNSECTFGQGSRRDKVKGYKVMCVDPYYSVAADLSIYKLGDVIYIPAAVGVVLPDGSVHTGYFVVRDSGGAIKGYGRFDFFTGFESKANPFRKAGFSDKDNNVPYYLVSGPDATNFLNLRNFPKLPVLK